MVKQIASRVVRVVKEEGITALLQKAVMVARYPFRRAAADNFDNGRNVDTTKEIPLWRLQIPYANAKFGFRYQATDPSFFSDALSAVPADFTDFTFLDLGCGKGRTLLLASEYKFKRIVGVEFSSKLAAIARQNISITGSRAEVIEADACQFSFPNENLLVYMYNPFGGVVMDTVITNLANWARTSNKLGFVAYVNPACRQSFQSVPEFQAVIEKSRVCVWKLRNSGN